MPTRCSWTQDVWAQVSTFRRIGTGPRTVRFTECAAPTAFPTHRIIARAFPVGTDLPPRFTTGAIVDSAAGLALCDASTELHAASAMTAERRRALLRSWARHLARVGPMLPIGMPNSWLICA